MIISNSTLHRLSYTPDDISQAIDLRKELVSVFINSGELKIAELAEVLIADNAKREKFIESMERKGVDTDEAFTIDKKYIAKKFKSKGFKTDSGFSYKAPFESHNDTSKIEYKYNGDGSVNITLKNVRNLQAT